MRKFVAIIMLGIFAFNIAGYQLIYNYMANRSDAALERSLDKKGYDQSELISIKQPTNLPYYTNSENFRRVDGEVEMNGIKYKYVMCRIFNDSLEMLCIPNKAKMEIEKNKDDYAKVAHDFQQNDSKKKSDSQNKSFQKSLSEFESLSLTALSNNSQLISNNYVLVNSVLEENRYFTSIEQPPDAAII